MNEIDALKAMYEEYFQKANQVRKKASLFSGFFGMGDDPRRHPCHENFYEALGEWVEAFAATDPAPSAVKEVVKWILEAPLERGGKDTYWYLYVAHGHTKKLIPLLEEEDRKAFAAWYDDRIPRNERLPVQMDVYRLLNPDAAKRRKKLFW